MKSGGYSRKGLEAALFYSLVCIDDITRKQKQQRNAYQWSINLILACTLKRPVKNDVLQQNIKTWRKELGKCRICYANRINNRVCGRDMHVFCLCHTEANMSSPGACSYTVQGLSSLIPRPMNSQVAIVVYHSVSSNSGQVLLCVRCFLSVCTLAIMQVFIPKHLLRQFLCHQFYLFSSSLHGLVSTTCFVFTCLSVCLHASSFVCVCVLCRATSLKNASVNGSVFMLPHLHLTCTCANQG